MTDASHHRFCRYWQELADGLGLPGGESAEIGDYLADQYGSPERHYHDQRHIVAMCDEIERLGAQFVALRAMQLAAFFHDVIYDVSRQDNELHSADELMQRLSDLADHDELELAANAIRATASHAATGDADIDLFVDIDMGVLGAPWPAYARYAHGVWAEFVPVYGETAFRHGRLELFLQPLLSCGEVFITRQFQPRTQLALNNLKREADILAAGQAVTPVC